MTSPAFRRRDAIHICRSHRRQHVSWLAAFRVGGVITPHTAGETRRYEDNVIMQENLTRLRRGETELLNRVV